MDRPGISASAQDVRAGGNIHNFNANNTVNNFYGSLSDDGLYGLAQWVSELDFSSQQSQAFEKHTRGTLQWVLDDPVFMAWLTGKKGGIIWGCGKPGAGKTTLLSFVVDHLEKLGDKDPSRMAAVCYVYCRYYTALTALQMFETILQQLILRCPSLDTNIIRKRMLQRRRLSLDDITSILKDCSSRVSNIFIVIDALDECIKDDTRGEVLQCLQSLSPIKIFITSRPSISSLMHGLPVLTIVAQDEDMKTYFRAQLNLNPELATLVARTNEADIEGKVAEKADGMFLLAQLHTAYLSTQTTVTQFRHALTSLPKEAGATYDHTLDRIRQQNLNKRRIAFRTLSWILFAPSPLSLIQLQHALLTHDFERMAIPDELTDGDTILSSCIGLVAVNKLKDRETTTVNFIHYTVREFLEQAKNSPDFSTEVHIATCCMKVISYPGIQSNPPNYPFIKYAAFAWHWFVWRLEGDNEVGALAVSQLRQSSAIGVLVDAYIGHRDRVFGCEELADVALYLIAVFDLTTICAAFLNTNAFLVRPVIDHYQKVALLWAAKGGYSKVISDLSYHPSYASGKDSKGRTPLSLAAEQGHLETVHELLSCEFSDVNAKDDTSGRTPLSWAAQNGHLGVVERLLRCSEIDVNARDNRGRTPVAWAAKNGHYEVVRELMQHPDISQLTRSQ